MARRPVVVPQFATDADPGAIVEPIEAVRNAGFATADRPPAQWFNWQFYHFGQWIDWLRSASTSNWTRVTTTFGANVSRIEVDIDTPEVASTARRIFVIEANGTSIWISARGHAWATVSPPAGTTYDLLWTGARWILGVMDSGTPKIYWSPGLTGTTAPSWTIATLPVSFTNVPGDLASDRDGNVAVHGSSTKLYYSTDDGSTFAEATLSAAASGTFNSIIWSGQAWIATTNTGEVYRTTSISGTWTKIVPTVASGSTMLATDGASVISVPLQGTAGDAWYISDDHGVTWDSMAAPDDIEDISSIRYLAAEPQGDGQWVLTSDSAPYIATANAPDADSWVRLKPPVTHAENVKDIALVEGAYIAIDTGNVALVSGRAVDLTPGPWQPTSAPVLLHDAAYLRGTLIEAAAPSNGDSLTYNSSTQQLEWSAAGGGGISYANEISALVVRAATTANITLSGEQTIDGVACVTGDRVLVKNHATGSSKGIYVVDSGAWSRAADASDGTELLPGRKVTVSEGTANADTTWTLTTNGPITVGVTSLTFDDIDVTKHTAQTITAIKTHTTNLQIIYATAASGGDTEVDSPYLLFRGSSWDGAAANDLDVRVRARADGDGYGGLDVDINGDVAMHVADYPLDTSMRARIGDPAENSACLYSGGTDGEYLGAAITFDTKFALIPGDPEGTGTGTRAYEYDDSTGVHTLEGGIVEAGTVTINDLAHTIDPSERNVILTNLSVPRTWTLPPLADCPIGHRISLWDASADLAGNGPITIDGDGSETINGGSDYSWGDDRSRVDLISTGSEWLAVISKAT